MPKAIIEFFEEELARSHRLYERYRFHYGEPITGRAWGDADDGYIALGISDDDTPSLIAMHSVNSKNGRRILVNNIVKIEKTVGGLRLYRHPRYHEGETTVHTDTPQSHGSGRELRRISLVRHSDG